MKYKLLAGISAGLLLARWRQSLVAAVGVTFGITMFISLLAFMTGLNTMLDSLVINRTPHIRMFNDIRPDSVQPIDESKLYTGSYNFVSSVKSATARLEIYNSGPILQSLTKDVRVLGFTPRITAQVFFNYGTLDLNGVMNGIDVEKENNNFFFSDYIIEGQGINLKNVSNSVILGKGLADKMMVGVGQSVTVTTTSGDRYLLKVVGIFQSGISDVDKVQSYAAINTVQKMLGKSNSYVTDIAIKLKDLDKAPQVAKEFAKLYGTEAEDIQTANAQFETGTRVRLTISYAVGITLLIVAGFGIYNILNMMIYEKMDSIAILKATGFAGRDVRRIFIAISLTIGFGGGIFGLLFGYLMSIGIHSIPFHIDALPTIKTYPINNNPLYYIIGITFSLITTYFAGFFPARKAGRVDPVVIIRGK